MPERKSNIISQFLYKNNRVIKREIKMNAFEKTECSKEARGGKILFMKKVKMKERKIEVNFYTIHYVART